MEKLFFDTNYKFQCSDNEKIFPCMSHILVKKQEEIVKSIDTKRCTSDADCALCDTQGETTTLLGKDQIYVKSECYNICSIPVNIENKRICLPYLERTQFWNMLCYVPDDPDKNCPPMDISRGEVYCSKGSKKCRNIVSDCPYTKAVCNKEKGVCEGVKE